MSKVMNHNKIGRPRRCASDVWVAGDPLFDRMGSFPVATLVSPAGGRLMVPGLDDPVRVALSEAAVGVYVELPSTITRDESLRN
jgi:hypothetical protein